MSGRKIKINRAPVMTLWAAVVAERIGFDEQAALSLGKAVAGLNAQSKGRSLGIYSAVEGASERKGKPGETPEVTLVTLLGRPVPAIRTRQGVRAAIKGETVEADAVQRYLQRKFGENLAEVRAAMQSLAAAHEPEELNDRSSALYEKFRPAVARGKRGWGAAGELDLELMARLADDRP